MFITQFRFLILRSSRITSITHIHYVNDAQQNLKAASYKIWFLKKHFFNYPNKISIFHFFPQMKHSRWNTINHFFCQWLIVAKTPMGLSSFCEYEVSVNHTSNHCIVALLQVPLLIALIAATFLFSIFNENDADK